MAVRPEGGGGLSPSIRCSWACCGSKKRQRAALAASVVRCPSGSLARQNSVCAAPATLARRQWACLVRVCVRCAGAARAVVRPMPCASGQTTRHSVVRCHSGAPQHKLPTRVSACLLPTLTLLCPCPRSLAQPLCLSSQEVKNQPVQPPKLKSATWSIVFNFHFIFGDLSVIRPSSQVRRAKRLETRAFFAGTAWCTPCICASCAPS